jgi:hypothetical protein
MTVLLGRTSAGTAGNFGNNTMAWPFVASNSGQLAVIKAQSKVANASITGVRLGVWSNGAGIPGTLLAVAAVDSLTAARGTGVFQATLASPVTIAAGTTYWLSLFGASEGYDFQGTAGAGWKGATGDHVSPFVDDASGDTTDAIIWGEDAATTAVVGPSPLLRMLVQRGRQQRALALSLLFPPAKTPALVDQSVSLTGFSNPAQFGALTVIPDQSVSLTGLDNPAQFGTPSVSTAGGDQTINPSGLSNPALFGTLRVDQQALLTGLLNAAQFGTIVRLDQEARLTGLLNAAQFGVVRLDDEARLTGLSNPALFGVVRLDQEARLSGFANAAQFGTPSPAQTVLLSGLFNPAQFGSVTIQGGGVVVSTARTRMTMGYGQ